MYQTNEYEGMLAETCILPGARGDLITAYFARPLDRAAAERFVAEAWRKLGLPDIGQ
jgi:hypothetical protein